MYLLQLHISLFQMLPYNVAGATIFLVVLTLPFVEWVPGVGTNSKPEIKIQTQGRRVCLNRIPGRQELPSMEYQEGGTLHKPKQGFPGVCVPIQSKGHGVRVGEVHSPYSGGARCRHRGRSRGGGRS